MGDFDKQQASAPSNEKKKLVMVGVLGAVLLGIGAFHFMKSNPATAGAALIPTADATAGGLFAEVTPAQETAALQNDPTATLLRNPQGPDPFLDTVPRNPFRIAPAWENILVRHADDAPVVDNHTQAYVTPTAAPKTVDTSTLKLTGIFRQGQKLYAIINGDIYTVGMVIDTAHITDITSTKVTLQRIESPNGPKASITIEPKLK